MTYNPAVDSASQWLRDIAAALNGGSSAGGSNTSVAVAVQAALTVIKASPGFLQGVLVTTAGTSTAMTFFDNASAASGKVIGVVPSGATAGQFFPFNMPAANGIVASGSATNPAVTVAYA